ncbi:hypothetical protein Angca_004343, partial [Angiostrongylus cantonensis]
FSEDSGQVRRCSHERKVWFDDEHLISGYCEASAPLFISSDETSQGCRDGVDVVGILVDYRNACKNLGIPTILSVERQIERFNQSSCSRQDLLSLKGETVSAAQMEALEEIFRRVQFDILDFEYTFLDDDVWISFKAAIALSEMLEFYESAQKLNLSFNKRITIRGWTDIFKAVKNCNSLQTLNLRYTSVSDKSLSTLCRTLRGTPQPVLGCLHLENVNLYGRNLYSLVCALKFNTVLRELYLGENNLQSADGAHLYQLITNNFTLQMLDLRNNQLADAGIVKLCEALRNPEVVKNSSLTALVLWNNKITANSMNAISGALCENFHIETINIGNNFIGELGVQRLRPALACNGSNLRRLGLQNTHMTCQSAILLAECLADNTTMVRVDLRDNPGIGSAGLLALHSAMKINTSISLLNLDQSCVVASSVKVSFARACECPVVQVRPYQENFRRYYDDIKRYCERNKLAVQRKAEVDTVDVTATISSKVDEPRMEDENKSEHGTTVNITMNVEMSPPHDQPTPLMTSSGPKGKFVRTSSLTCAETVSDIHERIRVMGGSTHSLDETNNDSTKTVKKFSVSSHNSVGLAEWSSLPAIPQANLSAKPTVRKLRRFSVSPSSSSFDVTRTPQSSSASLHESQSRPKTLALDVPCTKLAREYSTSASVVSSLPDSFESLSHTTVRGLYFLLIFRFIYCHTLFISAFDDSTLSKQENTASIFFEESVDATEGYSKQQECSGSEGAGTSKANPIAEEISHQDVEDVSVAASEDSMKDVRTVVSDLVNYVVYEETSVVERKRSLLLQNTSFPDSELASINQSCSEDLMQTRNSGASLRMGNIAELAEESDDIIVTHVVRRLVREVLRQEKEDLRNTLDRRRRRSGVIQSSSLI